LIKAQNRLVFLKTEPNAVQWEGIPDELNQELEEGLAKTSGKNEPVARIRGTETWQKPQPS
jgi:hypothetical protein